MTNPWHSDHPAHSSQLSQSRGFDTFIFWPSLPAARLFMGLNSEKMGPTNVSQLTRWISIWDPDFVEFYGPIKIHRINLKDAYYPLEYIAEHFGPPLELSDAVTPGDYGIFPGPIVDFTRIPGPSPHIVNRRPLDIEHERLVTMAQNFDLAKDGSKEDIDLLNAGLKLNSMSTDLIATVKEHNPLETCIFTGETAGTVISWIFPPALVRLVPYPLFKERIVGSDYTLPSNAAFMRADLVKHFLANDFGVDAEDHYRIRIFTKSEDMPPLPDRLPLSCVTNGTADQFFKLHFRWCVGTRLMGGDISKDYPSHAVRAFEETHCKGGDSDFDTPLSDPVWNTVIGKAVL